MKDNEFKILAVPGKQIVLTGEAAKRFIEEMDRPKTKEEIEEKRKFFEKCKQSAKLFKSK